MDNSTTTDTESSLSKKEHQRIQQSVSFDRDLVEKIKSTAETKNISRSKLIESFVSKGLENQDGKPTIIACLNFKGGVGKTTTASSVAVCLGKKGKKVLVIDFDPQGNASQIFNVFDKSEKKECIFDVMFSPGINIPRKKMDDVLEETKYENVSIVSSNFRFLEADSYFRHEASGADTLLKYAIEDMDEKFDYIIIDCGPRLDMTITNVLVAMEAGNTNSMVILPVKIDGATIAGLPKAISTIKNVADMRRTIPPNWHILVTIAERNTFVYKQGMEDLENMLPDNKLFATQIPKGTKANESSLAMQPLVSYEPNSAVARAYWELTKEIEAMNE